MTFIQPWLKWRITLPFLLFRFCSNKKLPPLKEEELIEKYISGQGPGGQNVNKSTNCVLLIHKPTGISVKCHESRLLQKNREIARLRLQEKVDFYENGDNSIRGLLKKEASADKRERKRRSRVKLEKLSKFRELLEESSGAKDS